MQSSMKSEGKLRSFFKEAQEPVLIYLNFFKFLNFFMKHFTIRKQQQVVVMLNSELQHKFNKEHCFAHVCLMLCHSPASICNGLLKLKDENYKLYLLING